MSAEAGVAGEVRRGLVWSTLNSLVVASPAASSSE